MGNKSRGVFRIGLHNINKLPEQKSSIRSRKAIQHIANGEYDILMLTEVGLYHPKVSPDNQWDERTAGVLHESKAWFAYNSLEPANTEVVQYGGVGIVATNEAVHRIIRHSKDPLGLGRWVSVSLQGKEGHVVTFFSVYRPVVNTSGSGSVYQQHLRHIGPDSEPRMLLLADLRIAVVKALQSGEHIIIGIDANEDVSVMGDVGQFMSSLGLREAILSHHPDKPRVETYRRNELHVPIDGIFVSPSIAVSSSGYLAYDEGIPSDHRCLWFEVSSSIAFGQKCPPLQKGPPRRLKTTDPRVVRKYNTKVLDLCQRVTLPHKLRRIKDFAAGNGWTKTLEIKYNKLHHLSAEIKLQVEQTVRKLPMGGKPWSPRLERFRETIALWEMMIRRRKRMKVSMTKIRRLAKKTGLSSELGVDLDEAYKRLDLAYKAYKQACKHAENWRSDHQDSLLEALADKRGTSREHELKLMIRHERQRKQSRNIKRARGKLGLGRVTKVYYETPDGKEVECSTKVTMDQAIIVENQSRFSQSEGTPPMRFPLLSDMGFYGQNAALQEVLQGSYPIPSHLDQYTKEFLRALQKPEVVANRGPTSTNISIEEHCDGWRKQREGTAAEPSGPSFSHFMAAIEEPVLAEMDRTFRALPYTYGFSPTLWRRITDVSILKKAGVYVVEKMRTIQLMFADFNMNNKKLGRDVMQVAEECRVIPPDQYGSRKRHRSIMAALNKRLTMDVLRQRRQAGALCSNDAKSCYDRIVHWVAVAALCRAGLAIAPALSMFLTLGLAVHYVSTAYGLSEAFYGKNRLIPLQGVGQGNGSGPSVWAVISAVLISMMYAAGHGAHFLSPISLSLVSFVCYAFVDDTDLVQVGETVDTPGEQVASAMQQAVNRWEGGLRASGGALVPKKSHWYLIDFVWRQSHWEYRNQSDMPASLSVVNTDGESRVILKRHDPGHAEETLGVKLSMDGNNRDQVAHLLEKTTEFADHIRVANLSRPDVWFATERCMLMTLEYCLPAVTLSAQEWKMVLAPILKYVLPKAGYDPNFPRRLLFAPRSYQGAGLMHPWHRQCLTHLLTVISETLATTLTGQLLTVTLEGTRLELGLSEQFWTKPFASFRQVVTPCWITNLWDYCTAHNIRVVDPQPSLQPFWSQDVFLMDEWSTRYDGDTLRKLNCCRLFLRITCLSEIATADGLYISYHAWVGLPADSKWNQYEWPRRPMSLPEAWWDCWRKALIQSFCLPNRRLRYDLGQPLLLPSRWRWFYSSSEDRVYHQEGALWRGYSKVAISRRTRNQLKPKFSRLDHVDTPPRDLLPVSIYPRINTGLVQMDGGPLPSLHQPQPNAVYEDREVLSSALVHEWHMIRGDLSSLAQSFRKGRCLVVSDGSFKEGRCTAAFTIRCQDTRAQLVGVNALPGPLELSDSYRGELSGLVGALELIRWISATHQVAEGTVTLMSDGEGALRKVSSGSRVSPQQACFDLLQKIQAQIKLLPINVEWNWVKGHQSGTRLSLPARLNNFCDETAKAYWQHVNTAQRWETSASFGEGWQVWLGNDKLTSISLDSLYQWAILFDDDLTPQAYWETKHNIPSDLFHEVDWDGIGRAIRSQPAHRQRWLPKFLSGFLATNQREHFRGRVADPSCPRCPAPVEDGRHIVKCQGHGADLVWNAGLGILDHQLTCTQTMPELQSILISRLRSWYLEAPHVQFQPSNHLLRKALEGQDRIGWHNFVYGRAHYLWAHAQMQYYECIGSSRSTRRWLSAILTKLWNISWDMWTHRNGIKFEQLQGIQSPLLVKLRSRLMKLSLSAQPDWTDSERHILEFSEAQLLHWTEAELRSRILSIIATRRRVKARLSRISRALRPMQAFMQAWLASGRSTQVGSPQNGSC